ncbi:DMT family transporter [Rhodobacter sp. Har01]|uniref:DMT family transporter n=1 Tax=Rhodobacter sp. Har01 TaxID=2883999 RepID=UPI001D07058C|nr:DMT family transporter [Rhodobacter sp. Har01]MCB6180051.1 DMT family transporter [Rhodobacter sp. Har01]
MNRFQAAEARLSDNARGVLLMNVAMAAFTLNDTAMKAAMQTLPLYQAIGLRGLLSTLALVLIGLRLGALSLRLPRRDLGFVGLRTLGEVASTLTFLAALVHMKLANLSAIMQALPLAVTLAAAVFLGERIGWRRALAIAVGFVGVLIIIRPGTEGFDRWSVLGIVSVGFVVLRDLATRKMSRAVPSVTVAVIASAAVMAMGLAGATLQGWQPVSLRELALILFAGLALIAGYLSVVATMRVGDIGAVAPFRYMALLWAIILGWLVFGQLPDFWTLVGSGLVVASGLFALLRERSQAPGALRR